MDLMFQNLVLALKAGNIEACFVLSGFSFPSLGPKLYIVSLPKCAVYIKSAASAFMTMKNFVHNY